METAILVKALHRVIANLSVIDRNPFPPPPPPPPPRGCCRVDSDRL